MKVTRLGKKQVDDQPLPQMIREYILHDRGNSIFLGDSFANLPSPVGEGQTIKNLFKVNEDDDELQKLDRENKEKNEIKIEGKDEKSDKKKASAKKEGAGNDISIDMDEIDKIVFQKPRHPKKTDQQNKDRQKSLDRMNQHDPYQDVKDTYKIGSRPYESVDNSLLSAFQNGDESYVEEDSYINPSNVSKVN